MAPPPAPQDHSIERLTAQATALLAQSQTGDARSRVALGGVLQQVRAKLEHGQWLSWLEGTVPFTARSAQNYIELSTWANARQAVFEKVAPLGASKVYLLSKLEPALLDQLLAKPDHLVPGTRRRTTLGLMTYAELMKTLVQATKPPAGPVDPMAELVSEARSSVSRTIKMMKELIANKDGVDHEAVEDMHDDLVVALQAVSKAFKLD